MSNKKSELIVRKPSPVAVKYVQMCKNVNKGYAWSD